MSAVTEVRRRGRWGLGVSVTEPLGRSTKDPMASGARLPGRALIGVVMGLWGVVCVGPIIWMLVDSLRSTTAIFLHPFGVPAISHANNYSQAWSEASLGRSLIISILVNAGAVLLAGCCSLLAGFAISRGRLPISNAILTFFLIGLMVPIFAALIPLVVLYQQLQLINTDYGLILVYAGFSIPLGVFLFKNAFDTIPQELLDAASVDGASVPRLVFRILLPMVRPTLATFAILTFLNGYNDYVFALVLLSGTGDRTLPLALLQFSTQYGTEYNLVFAAVAIATVPPLIAYGFMRRQIQSSLALGGVLK